MTKKILLITIMLLLVSCSEKKSDNESGATDDTGLPGQLDGGVIQTGTATEVPVFVDADVHVKIDRSVRYQTLEGFGAAVGWFHGSLLQHPKRQEIYPILFSELGLDILRFRNQHSRSDPGDNDIVEDAQILEAATASLGHRPKVMLSSWSPPAHLKANGNEECTGNDDCTLVKTDSGFDYTGFANWWHESLLAYHNAGVVPDFVSIQNEPDFIPNGWEGCRFEPQETDQYPGYAMALQAVHQALGTMETPPKLLGPEVLGIHWNKPRDFISAMDLSLVYGTCHHLYEMGNDGVWDWRDPGPDSFIEEMETAASASGDLPIFQTEFQTDDDNNIEGGFETAWLIHNSLFFEGVSAFLYWDLVWPERGLVALLQGNTEYRIRDQYYAVKHYARLTDPGHVRIRATTGTSDIRATAFESPAADQLTVVTLNVGESPVTIAVELDGFTPTSKGSYRTVYNPGTSTVWEDVTTPTPAAITLPPRSQLTTTYHL